jgi:hypothetical protein
VLPFVQQGVKSSAPNICISRLEWFSKMMLMNVEKPSDERALKRNQNIRPPDRNIADYTT